MAWLPAWPGLALAAVAAAPLGAQTIVTSTRPDSVDVTVYRAPGRSPDTPFELDWLEGYALISETRTVSLPAGESEVRFEGVAGGILPQSAIVSGFPDGVVERNRDAHLLSPESLLDRSLGRRVHLRRTSTVSGAVREQDAVIRSDAEGAVVLETAEGVETLRCTGLPETLVYDGVPAGLSARPTLSVRARASRPVTATVTLAYLADGFDWQANYIAELAPSGDRMDLFAWLTLASNDETSFVDANTQAVAGRLNRAENEREVPEANPLTLRCWPLGRTSDGSAPDARLTSTTRTEDLINELPQAFAASADEENIIVTAATLARQEDLGDLKLYRLPEPVTVAANGQKQVAFLQRAGIPVAFVYRQRFEPDDNDEPTATNRVLVARNRTDTGLGVPLPGGGFQLFESGGARPVLIGEGSLNDHAVGEEVEIPVGESSSVMTQVDDTAFGDDWEDHLLTVTNAQPVPVRYEAEFEVDEDEEFRPGERLGRRDGRPLWAVTVPANGSATLRYRVVERDD